MLADQVTHAVFATYARNLDAAAAYWVALGVEFEEFTREDYGLRILFSWTHGVEIIAPVDPRGSFAGELLSYLDGHGEGLYKVNYGVADLDETVRRVNAQGVPCRRLPRTTTGHEPWIGRFIKCDEAMPDNICDMAIMYIEEDTFEPPAKYERVCEATFCLMPGLLDKAANFWRGALDVDVAPAESPQAGQQLRFAPLNGVRLVTADPVAPSPALADFLARTGGGAYSATFRVADLDRAIAAAAAHGVDVVDRHRCHGLAGWERFDRREEAELEPLFGMRVILAEFEPLPRVA